MRSKLWGLAAVPLIVFTGVVSSQSVAWADSLPGGAAIHTVLASRLGGDFRYFPHYVGSARCGIPFVWGRRIKGTCTTQVAPRRGHGGQTLVTFSERWPWREFHYSGAPRRTLHHHWVFDLLPSGKIVFVHQTGDFPPNFAR